MEVAKGEPPNGRTRSSFPSGPMTIWDPIPSDLTMPAATAARFIKLGQRRSMAISIVNLCARLTLAGDGAVTAARIVLGAVAPTPLRAIAAETVLVGKELSAELLDQAAQCAGEEISPINDVRASADYRGRMTRVLVRRALTSLWDELGGNHCNG